jgi:flagellar basal body-associated protein FliL
MRYTLKEKMSKNKLEIIITVIAVAVAVALFGYWYFVMRVAAPLPVAEPSVASLAEPASLGETIYQQSQNPIKNEIPAANNPTVNPIEGAYKNPFE